MLATRQFRLLPKPQGSDKVIRIPLMIAQSVELAETILVISLEVI
jgi:hypothetical protein